MDAPPPRRTLMEKWKEHYDTRDQIFKLKPQTANKAGMAFFWMFSVCLLMSAVHIMIPQLARYEVNKQFWMKTLAWFIFVESVLNWFLTCFNRRSQVNDKTVPQTDDKLVRSLPEGWKSCPTCQLDSPPRSHHCKVCQMCVLKRHHHCFFSGSCIGFYNQRYFVVFAFYVTLGCMFGTYLVLTYLADPLPLMSRHGVTYFPPVAFIKWFIGYLSSAHLFLLGQLYACCVCLVGGSWFFGWEMFMIYRGQTTYEAMRGIGRYRVNIMHHFRSTFGPFWMVNFLVPLPTQQQGNGVDWLITSNVKTK